MNRRASYVYLFVTADAKFCKVGIAQDAQRRLNNVQVCCPLALILRAKFGPFEVDDAGSIERIAHRKLKNQSVHVRGEWFGGHASRVAEAVIVEAIAQFENHCAQEATDPCRPLEYEQWIMT